MGDTTVTYKETLCFGFIAEKSRYDDGENDDTGSNNKEGRISEHLVTALW